MNQANRMEETKEISIIINWKCQSFVVSKGILKKFSTLLLCEGNTDFPKRLYQGISKKLRRLYAYLLPLLVIKRIKGNRILLLLRLKKARSIIENFHCKRAYIYTVEEDSWWKYMPLSKKKGDFIIKQLKPILIFINPLISRLSFKNFLLENFQRISLSIIASMVGVNYYHQQ